MAIFILGFFTMALFGANSILCRFALTETAMDPGSFTLLRIVSGALTLLLLMLIRDKKSLHIAGSNRSAIFLFIYMTAFSYSYIGLPAATGAFVMVVSIFVTLLVLCRSIGESLRMGQIAGAGISLAGLVLLLGPAVSRPPMFATCLMLLAGIAWGIYSFLGRHSDDPFADTTGNFVRCLPLTLVVLPFIEQWPLDGVVTALFSGSIASGVCYSAWYYLVTRISAFSAGLAHLSIPAFAAFGAWLFLGEALSLRLVCSGLLILLGMAFANGLHLRSQTK